MAVALGGMILTAAAAFVFGVFNLTLMAEREPLFDEHVESTARFLEYAFASAIQAGADSGDQGEADDNARNENAATPRIAWKRLPGGSGLNPEAISFRMRGDLPIFVQEETAFLPEVECFLVFDDNDGLVLRWRTDAMKTEDADALLASMLSPYVKELTYYYYDREDDSWDDSDEAEQSDEGQVLLPDFISLKFEHPDGREATRQILLPAVDVERPLP